VSGSVLVTVESASGTAVPVTLPSAPFAVKEIALGANTLTIAGSTGITAKVTSMGKLALPATITAAALTGTGNVQFTGTPVFAAESAVFHNTGRTTFEGNVTFTDGASFEGDMVFGGM
jgi:hypothetical protein